jgi:2-C-methyl-D-erythritol 4-phosphate cytidylyltransferase
MITLIIPCAGKSSRYPGIKPKWMFTHPDGKIMLEKSVTPFLKNKKIKKKIITITKEIEKKFQVKFLIKQMFANQLKVLVLNSQTKSASETVM